MAEITTTTETVADPELEAVTKFAAANVNSLPANFGGDPQKFIDSWKEQRATLTRTQQENAALKAAATAGKPEEKPAEKAAAVLPDALKIEKQAEADGSLDAWRSEILTKGDLSPESRAAVKAKFAGIPDDLINSHVAAVKSEQKAQVTAAAELVGGAEVVTNIIAWAQKSLKPDEIAAVNESFTRPGWDNVLLGLKARMDQANPTRGEPGATPGTVSAAGGSGKATAFANSTEQTRAFQDPRYNVDPVYTKLVQDRMRATAPIVRRA